MDQAKLVKKHGEMHQKLQLAQKRMESVKTKFDRFDAERKLRATVATHDENAQAASDAESDTKSDTWSDSGSGQQEAAEAARAEAAEATKTSFSEQSNPA